MDAAANLITLNQRFKWDGFLRFRLFALGEHAQQHSDLPPRSRKLGTRHLSGLLANTTEGDIILAQMLAQCIIEFIGEQTNPAINPFFTMFFMRL